MKQISIIFILALAICIGASSFATPVAASGRGPLLVIDTSNANLGEVPNKGFVNRTFVLRNEGDSVLHITQVRPTCGCTVAELSDSTIAPNGSTTIKIRLSANQAPGNFYKNIYIASNSRDTSSTWLKFYGHFVAATSETSSPTKSLSK